jgi:ABC-type sugar transport system ATPase subunit
MTLGEKVVVMRKGEIHQIDHPEKIYDHPADTFVATFIGSPEINLYRGNLVSRNDHPHFRGKGFYIELTGTQVGPGYGEVEVGIRPEDIEMVKMGEGGQQVVVEMISDIGSEKFIHTRLGEEPLTLRVEKETVLDPGEVIPIRFKPDRLHIFSKGQRIN